MDHTSPVSPVWAGRLFITEPPGNPVTIYVVINYQEVPDGPMVGTLYCLYRRPEFNL